MSPFRRPALRPAIAALILFFLAAAVPAGAAQDSAGPAPERAEPAFPKTLKQAGRDLLRDTGRIWSSPARMRERDIVPLAAFALGAGVLITRDGDVRDGVRSYAERHAWVGDISPVVTQFGGPGGFAVAGAFLGAGLLFKDDRARDTGYLAASAILQTILVDSVIKIAAGRRRPYVADGQDHWGGPAGAFEGTGEDNQSFPSGHAAQAFALATVISLQYRRTVWVPVAAYALATAAGLSRMTMDKHWASDVLVGAVVGHVVARLVVRDHARRGRLTPLVSGSPRGFAVSLFYDLGERKDP